MELKSDLWDRPLMAALFIDLVSTGARLATIDEIGILRARAKRKSSNIDENLGLLEAFEPKERDFEPF